MEGMDSPEEITALHELKLATLGMRPMVLLQPEKLTWSVGAQDYPQVVLEVLAGAFPEKAKKLEVDLRAEARSYEARNVVGKIAGRRSDSCLVISAHYDHLGRFGEALFPGASDNASGVATMLDMAQHFKAHTPEFDIWFIAFAAEEAGLKGSKYFVDHPLVPLEEIKLLMNLDLMGSAAKGITVVNGRLYPELMSAFAAINTKNQYLPKIKLRGKAANSDHYWFSEAGVTAIFIYTEGNITAYHDVHDVAEGLDWANYSNLFTLLTTFISTR
jgi:Zn-dependent M28 family amino/carboxypeptidase